MRHTRGRSNKQFRGDMPGKTLKTGQSKPDYSNDKGARDRLMQQLIRHLEGGYSYDCFHFVTRKTLKELRERFPDDFPGEDIEAAQLKGQFGWEQLGRKQSDGSCLGNSRSWYYNMVNRYGWKDKQEIKQDVTGSVSVSIVNYSDNTGSQ